MSKDQVQSLTIGGRWLLVRSTNRAVAPGFDVFERSEDGTEQRLTLADPFSREPTRAELTSFLSVRKQRLVALMASHNIVPGNDYQYEDDYELLESERPAGRWVAVYGDETYHQLYVTDDLQAALDQLGSIIYEEYCNVPEGVYDLDEDRMLAIASTVRLTGVTTPGPLVPLTQLTAALTAVETASEAGSSDGEIAALSAALDAALTRWPELPRR